MSLPIVHRTLLAMPAEEGILQQADIAGRALIICGAVQCPSKLRLLQYAQVLSVEQRQVLQRRGGAVLSRRSILKTATPRPSDDGGNVLHVPGVADIR